MPRKRLQKLHGSLCSHWVDHWVTKIGGNLDLQEEAQQCYTDVGNNSDVVHLKSKKPINQRWMHGKSSMLLCKIPDDVLNSTDLCGGAWLFVCRMHRQLCQALLLHGRGLSILEWLHQTSWTGLCSCLLRVMAWDLDSPSCLVFSFFGRGTMNLPLPWSVGRSSALGEFSTSQTLGETLRNEWSSWEVLRLQHRHHQEAHGRSLTTNVISGEWEEMTSPSGATVAGIKLTASISVGVTTGIEVILWGQSIWRSELWGFHHILHLWIDL